MIDAMAPGVRDAMMGTLMEPALHAVEAVARQATLGDKYEPLNACAQGPHVILASGCPAD